MECGSIYAQDARHSIFVINSYLTEVIISGTNAVLFHCCQLMNRLKLPGAQTAVSIFHLTQLIIVRINPHSFDRRQEIRLELGTGRHAVRIKITKVKFSSLLTSHPGR